MDALAGRHHPGLTSGAAFKAPAAVGPTPGAFVDGFGVVGVVVVVSVDSGVALVAGVVMVTVRVWLPQPARAAATTEATSSRFIRKRLSARLVV